MSSQSASDDCPQVSGPDHKIMDNNDKQERTIYISNIEDEKFDDKLLEEIFIQVGPIESITLKDQKANVEGKTNKPRFAFVEFSDVESVIFACKLMDGIELFGRKIKVQPRDNTTQKAEYARYQQEKREAMKNQMNQPRAHNIHPQQLPISHSNSYGGMYGDQPTPINDLPFIQQDSQRIIRGSWPMQQQSLIPQSHTTSVSVKLYNSGNSSKPMFVQPQNLSLMNLPPQPPNFYQQQANNVKEQLEMNGGKYRPKQYFNVPQANHSWGSGSSSSYMNGRQQKPYKRNQQ